jgi:hypothetical protein
VRFKRRNLEALGNLICGNLGSDDPNADGEPSYFPYRSSMYITEFFRELDTDWTHDRSTRHRWVADVLESMLAEPHDGPAHPPENFCRVIDHLMSPGDATNEALIAGTRFGSSTRCSPRKASRPFEGRTSTATCGTLAPKRSPCWRRIRTGRSPQQRWSAATNSRHTSTNAARTN